MKIYENLRKSTKIQENEEDKQNNDNDDDGKTLTAKVLEPTPPHERLIHNQPPLPILTAKVLG